MKITDLNKIRVEDIKNVDIFEIKDRLFGRPELMINMVLILLTGFIGLQIFFQFSQKTKDISEEVKTLTERAELLDQQTKVEKEYAEFISEFPQPLMSDQLSDKLSQFAKTYRIQIKNMLPARTKDTELFALTSVDINITATDYGKIVEFMKAIETSNYAIRVEKWSSRVSEKTNNVQSNEDPLIEATMTIGSITLKGPVL